MEAACRGAKGAGGMTVGILPGALRTEANAWVDVAVATGIGEARNAIIARTVDALIAVGGEFGTLSEMALALAASKPVIGLDSWDLVRAGEPHGAIATVSSAEEAVALAARMLAEHA
ncbi:MAG: hypothetical protein NVSMB25_11400 [Thermoleophilaceae bacterium]